MSKDALPYGLDSIEKSEAILAADLSQLIKEKGLLIDDEVLEEVLNSDQLKSVLRSFYESEASPKTLEQFLNYCAYRPEPVFLEKLIIDIAQSCRNDKKVYSQYQESYLSEVLPADRLELVPKILDEKTSQKITKFRFRIKDEPQLAITSDEFLEDIINFVESGAAVGGLDLQSAQIYRWGVVAYFDELLALMNEMSDNDAEMEYLEDRKEGLRDFIAGFIFCFSDPDNDIFILDQRMSKSLEETLWFAHKIGFEDKGLNDFTEAAITVADKYLGRERKVETSKHPNDVLGKERASAFEHFLTVSRYTFGTMDSLFFNSKFGGKNQLLDRLVTRPDYKIELLYTSLLHDVIEDKQKNGEPMMSEAEVGALLKKADIPESLADQIMKNLKLLNAKRGFEGELISVDEYTDQILKSGNPVLVITKYADILHNSQSETKSKWEKDSEGEKTNKLSALWQQKQKAYDAVIMEMTLNNPVHVRPQDLIKIASANPELFQFKGWATLLRRHPQKENILSALQAETKTKVYELISSVV